MEFNEKKVDEAVLALMHLSASAEKGGLGSRTWKGYDWETLNRLHEQGHISNPKTKAKSVILTAASARLAEDLFNKYFVDTV